MDVYEIKIKLYLLKDIKIGRNTDLFSILY